MLSWSAAILVGVEVPVAGRDYPGTLRAFNMWFPDDEACLRYLIRDRDSKYTRDFDTVIRSEGIEIVRTPVRAPKANAIAERVVRTVRSECLDWLLILNRRHLECVLRVFVDHYNRHRPHRSLALRPPERSSRSAIPLRAPPFAQLTRTDLLGGLIHEYEHAA